MNNSKILDFVQSFNTKKILRIIYIYFTIHLTKYRLIKMKLSYIFIPQI